MAKSLFVFECGRRVASGEFEAVLGNPGVVTVVVVAVVQLTGLGEELFSQLSRGGDFFRNCLAKDRVGNSGAEEGREESKAKHHRCQKKDVGVSQTKKMRTRQTIGF